MTKTDIKYLTVDEVAEALKMSTKTVRRRIADGSLKASRSGRLLRIAEDDVIEYMRKGEAQVSETVKNPKLRLIKKRNGNGSTEAE